MDRVLIVITPAASKNLTTLATVKTELGISDNAKDALLNRYIATASRAAANICNGEFIAEAIEETFRPYPFVDSASLTNLPEYIFLRRMPVTAFAATDDIQPISLVTEDGAPLVEGTDFQCDHSTGRMMRLSNDMPLRWHFRKLVVRYVGGYTFPGTLEPDIEQATIEIIKDMWSAQKRDPLIKEEDIPGVRRVAYWVGGLNAGSWPPKVMDLLSPWQRPMF